jgi:hypothetical protein
MLVVHGGNEYRVNVFAIENGAIVAGGRDAGIVDGFLGGDVASVVYVADGDALNAGDLERGLQVFASANAGADGGESVRYRWERRARGRREQMRLQNILGDRGGGECAGAEMNESDDGTGILGHGISVFRFQSFRDSAERSTRVLSGGIIPQERGFSKTIF